jgi:tRNA(fMet)-specific endonuclease VapC
MYVFDTDVVSATMRREVPLTLVRRLASVPREEQVTTAITLGELVYGAEKRRSGRHAAAIRELVFSRMPVLPYDHEAAEVYGSIRAELERRGEPLEHPDLQIAAIALARDLTLVTGDTRHFDRVPGLRVENWLAPAT